MCERIWHSFVLWVVTQQLMIMSCKKPPAMRVRDESYTNKNSPKSYNKGCSGLNYDKEVSFYGKQSKFIGAYKMGM